MIIYKIIIHAQSYLKYIYTKLNDLLLQCLRSTIRIYDAIDSNIPINYTKEN